MNKRMIAGAIAIGVALLMSAACNSSVEEDPTPVTKFKITPASGSRTIVATPTAAATPAPDGTPGAEIAIKASGSTLKFDKTELAAAAGTVTILFDHQDGGVVHNISVFEGTSASGTLMGKTDLETGPVKQTLTLDLKAGAYFFQCDAHPTTMKGKLTVT
jgi:plastocyanin